MQEPCKILEKEAFKICLKREVTSKHTDTGKMGPGRANPRAQNSQQGGAGLHGEHMESRGRIQLSCGREAGAGGERLVKAGFGWIVKE